MAKLSARNQVEEARFERVVEFAYTCTTDSNPVVWRHTTYAFMTNGRILKKEDVRWQDGMKHTYNWTVVKLKVATKTPEERAVVYARLTEKGYRRA